MPDSAIDLLNQRRLENINNVATELGVRPELVHAMIGQESGGYQTAVSPKKAVGLMQLMPATAAQYPGDINNPDDNLRIGITHFKRLLDKYKGNESLALAAYNAGEKPVDTAGAIPNYPETQQYVQRILQRAGQPNQSASPAAPQTSAIDILNSRLQQQATPPPNLFNAVRPKAPSGAEPGFLDNVVSSGKNFFTGIGHAVAHPIDTASNLLSTTVGAAQSALPDSATKALTEGAENPALDKRPYSQAMVDFYKKRYGGWDNIKHTAYTDPVGTMADVAGGLTLGGEALSGANLIARSSKLGTIADIAKTTGSFVDPLQLPGNVASLTIQPPARALAKRIINSNVKPDSSLVKRNPGVDIPEVILDEGFSAGAKGAGQAKDLTKQLSAEVTALAERDAQSGRTYTLQSLMDNLKELEQKYLHSPAGMDNVMEIRRAMDELRNHPLYSKDRMGTVMVPQQTQVPHPTAIDAQGNPIMQTQTVMTPQQQVVGRDLVPQDAAEINTMKKNIYEDNPKSYGEQKGAAEEGDKAQGRALKTILDDNVDGVKDINARQGGVITAGKALRDMGIRESKKYPVGLLDMLALSSGRNPIIATLLLKHPTTAFPIAKALYKAGTVKTPGMLKPVVANLTPAERVNEGTAEVNKRKVTKAELDQRYDSYLNGAQSGESATGE